MAIAFDTGLFNQGSGSSPVSWSHTVTGSNPNLLVAVQLSGLAGDVVTGVTYGGVAMTKLQYSATVTLTVSLWYLGNPSTGSNTVSVTFTSGSWSRGSSISYKGCASTVDNSGANNVNTGSSPLSLSITSVANNSWMTMFSTLNNSAIAAGTNTTARSVDPTFGIGFYDTNGPITPAGARSLQVTWSGLQDIVLTGATLAPFVSLSTNSNFLMFM